MTGGSDSKVVLLNVASLASSDPVTEDEEEEKNNENDQSKVCVSFNLALFSVSLYRRVTTIISVRLTSINFMLFTGKSCCQLLGYP